MITKFEIFMEKLNKPAEIVYCIICLSIFMLSPITIIPLGMLLGVFLLIHINNGWRK